MRGPAPVDLLAHARRRKLNSRKFGYHPDRGRSKPYETLNKGREQARRRRQSEK
jgi:hypothetical protein